VPVFFGDRVSIAARRNHCIRIRSAGNDGLVQGASSMSKAVSLIHDPGRPSILGGGSEGRIDVKNSVRRGEIRTRDCGFDELMAGNLGPLT
jgi:hypothetical protein